jgi:hypothetical protein
MHRVLHRISHLGLVALLAGSVAFSHEAVGEAPPAPPLAYNAASDAKVYPKPDLPKLGPAGFVFKDPTFGCPIVRVTDEQTAAGGSVMTPAGGEANNWNVDSTLFCVLHGGNANIPFRFDPQTMTASPIKDLPYLPEIQNAVAFSRHDPHICYGTNARRNVLVQFDFSTHKASDVIDVAKLTGEQRGHMGALSLSANDVLCLVFGGPAQNASPYLLVYDIKTGKHRIWNTKEGTIDGKPVPGAPKFTQHAGEIDRSGRYVWSGGPGVSGPIVWDIQTNEIYPITVEFLGHRAVGFGDMVNDVHKWIYRTLERKGIDHPVDLMEHPAGEPYFQYDSHISWNNTRPAMKVPAVLSTYHRLEMGDPKCAYGDEVLAVATDGSKRIWRFAHHRSTIHMPTRNPLTEKYNFWDTPRGNVSQDGRFFMFTSNWEETLGKDPRSRGPVSRFREDVFLVKLDREGGSPADPAGK